MAAFTSFLEGWAPNSAASQQAEKHPIPPRGKGWHNPHPQMCTVCASLCRVKGLTVLRACQ
jgi:hypothetical protein